MPLRKAEIIVDDPKGIVVLPAAATDTEACVIVKVAGVVEELGLKLASKLASPA